MREVLKKMPEKKQMLLRDIISRYLDHNPALRMSDGELKKHTKGKIEQFVKESVRKRPA